MTFESKFWKRDLKVAASRLKKFSCQADWTESQCARMQKDVVISAFVVRKLWECSKLSRETIEFEIAVEKSPPLKNEVLFFDKFDFWESYDMDSLVKEKVKAEYLCNQIIHSFVFQFVEFSEDITDLRFVVNSDYSKNQHLWIVKIDDYIQLLIMAWRDYPSFFTYYKESVDGKVIEKVVTTSKGQPEN